MNKNRFTIAVVLISLVMALLSYFFSPLIAHKGTYGSMCNYRIENEKIIVKSSFNTKVIHYKRSVLTSSGREFRNYENKTVAILSPIKGLRIIPEKE